MLAAGLTGQGRAGGKEAGRAAPRPFCLTPSVATWLAPRGEAEEPEARSPGLAKRRPAAAPEEERSTDCGSPACAWDASSGEETMAAAEAPLEPLAAAEAPPGRWTLDAGRWKSQDERWTPQAPAGPLSEVPGAPPAGAPVEALPEWPAGAAAAALPEPPEVPPEAPVGAPAAEPRAKRAPRRPQPAPPEPPAEAPAEAPHAACAEAPAEVPAEAPLEAPPAPTVAPPRPPTGVAPEPPAEEPPAEDPEEWLSRGVAPPPPKVRFAEELEEAAPPGPGGRAPPAGAGSSPAPAPAPVPRQAPPLRQAPDRQLDDFYRRCVRQQMDGHVEISLAKQRMTDEPFAMFCDWAKANLRRVLRRPPQDLSFDFAENRIGDRGCAALASLLDQLRMPVFQVKLFKNDVGDEGAEHIAGFLLKNPMHELHLSHNSITPVGAQKLLGSVARAADQRGLPIFPLHPERGRQRPKPLWLRLENNCLADDGGGRESVRKLMKDAEQELRKVREDIGFLERSKKPTPMLCEVGQGFNCNSKGCSQLCPCALFPGRAAGPIAQVPFICNQKPAERYSAGVRPPTQRAAAPQARTPSPPPQQVAAASSSTCGVEGSTSAADAGPVVRPSRFKDIRLSSNSGEHASEGGAPVPSWVCSTVQRGEPAAARLGEAAARSPPAAQGPGEAAEPCAAAEPDVYDMDWNSVGPQGSPEPAAAPLEVVKGGRARAQRAVTGPPPGYEPDYFLIGLPEGAEVEVLLIGEGADAGWCWAATSAGESGWLALDALHGV